MGLAEQRHHDGRAGYDQNPAKDRRHRPRQPSNIVGGESARDPTERCSEQHKPLHRAACITQAMKIQRQTTFKD